MSAAPVFAKDPSAVLDYGWDLTRWLAAGESVIDCSWAITGPAGDPMATSLAVDADFPGFDSGEYVESPRVAVALKLGTPGARYTVDAIWTTDQGRVDSRAFVVRVMDR